MSSVSVSDTFQKAIERFSSKDQSKILKFLFKFLENPASPGLNLESVNNAIDPGMKSARIDRGIRAIVHQAGKAFTLLHVDSHDDAYKWATKRRIENHPVTGALQLVEAAESIEPAIQAVATVPQLDSTEVPPKRIFASFDDAYLLSLGVPQDWLLAIRQIENDDQLLLAASRLPSEVGDALVALASGEIVTPPVPVAQVKKASSKSRVATSRFWVVESAAELMDILSKPLGDWIRFLHPTQRKLVHAKFAGPSKITGAAGTGKTVVGLHRAHRLATEGKRVLMTSYVKTLCQNNARQLAILHSGIVYDAAGHDVAGLARVQALHVNQLKSYDSSYDDSQIPILHSQCKITCNTVHAEALHLAKKLDPRIKPIPADKIAPLISRFHSRGDAGISIGFLETEWHGVIEPHGIFTWQEYRGVTRYGRGKPLTVKQRKSCWQVFEAVREAMASAGQVTWAGICKIAKEGLEAGKIESPYDAVIVDEVQDLQVQEILFLNALAKNNPGELMLLGDAGQRIYPGGFSLKKLGINTVGRSHVLRINYRTTEQIRKFSDAIMPDSSEDFNAGAEKRNSVSLLHGPTPELHGFDSADTQVQFVVEQIKSLVAEKIAPHEIAIFARTSNHLKPHESALQSAGISTVPLDSDDTDESIEGVNLGTMHRAKGLEFKVVFVIDASDTVIPNQFVMGKMRDQGDYDDAFQRERQLLYVAMTRARDELFITYVGKPSQFLAKHQSQ